jgi:endonuclease/exonuclease/phosphatase family metal-dependent hydrolase
LPVIAVGVGSKHPIPTVIAVIAALVPWTLVTGYAASGPGRVSVGAGNTLRVMSVNGSQGRADAKQIVALARSYRVDVVVITGLTSGLAHRLTVEGLSGLTPSRWVDITPDGTDGAGLWSRLEVRDLRPVEAVDGSSVQGSIEAGPDEIAISAVHLGGDPLRPAKGWHADMAALGLPPGPGRKLLVGDLNATPWQPAFRKLTKVGWRDAADVVGQGMRPTWPAWSPVPVAPIDHVLVSGGLGVTAADTTTLAGTDHRALVVTLVLPHVGD